MFDLKNPQLSKPSIIDHPNGMTNDPKTKALLDALMGDGDLGMIGMGAIPAAISSNGVKGMSPLGMLSGDQKFRLLQALGG